MQTLRLKNEATWYGMLGHLGCRIRYNPENIQGMVARKAFHTTWAAFNRWNDERNVNVNRNDNDWNDNWWFAGLRKCFHFSPACAGEFCFAICPLQPPSILPISSILRESVMYFASSIDFVSQSIIRNIARTSVFRIAIRTYGYFSCRGRKPAVAV